METPGKRTIAHVNMDAIEEFMLAADAGTNAPEHLNGSVRAAVWPVRARHEKIRDPCAAPEHASEPIVRHVGP
jgi:hypothetical protein